MFVAPQSPHLVPFDGSFRIIDASTRGRRAQRNKAKLRISVARLDNLQKALFAANRHSLLLIFQGMDAAGKDSTIRSVMSGVNPAGCQVFGFKKPSSTELDHDFLWRTARCLPERGRIGVFNRSYYEEVLIVRVHPEILDSARLPGQIDLPSLWTERFDSIRDHELHLARNGTVILKFFLNVSRQEQTRRFIDRLDTPRKQWKFNAGDMAEREHWQAYMSAFEDALNATSREWAPWYAIPADHKLYMRAAVARIIVDALDGLGLRYPEPAPEDKESYAEWRRILSRPIGQ